MAQGYHDFVAGEVLSAANLEDYCQNQSVMRFASTSARDTAVSSVKTAGMKTHQTDTGNDTVYSGSAWSTSGPLYGALTSWTPTVTQSGSVTVTVNYATYQRIGRRVTANFVVTVTGSGTAVNTISITLPVTAVSATAGVVGPCEVFDSSASTIYTGVAIVQSTTTFSIYAGGGVTGPLGVQQMTAALAVGDQISGSLSYEVATDA